MPSRRSNERWDRPAIVSPVAALAIGLLIGIAIGYTFYQTDLAPFLAPRVTAGAVREFKLSVQESVITMGGGVVWNAWTFNGTVPGPTIRAKAGDTIRIKVTNNLDLIHSLHTHLAPYVFESDGSQANIIAGKGQGAMIPPKATYTYEFHTSTPGLFYYHCHSADGHLRIVDHILQGLYGAIIVDDVEAPPAKDFIIFMAEVGHKVTGKAPPYLLNGKGIPGGEHTLEELFKSQGFAAVAAQLNVSVLAFKAKIGETIRLHVINIGDQIHSFHLHGMTLTSQGYFPGRAWPANVVQLLPGAAETVLITPTYEGLWLFHCHVVSHADQGMIGVLIVEP